MQVKLRLGRVHCSGHLYCFAMFGLMDLGAAYDHDLLLSDSDSLGVHMADHVLCYGTGLFVAVWAGAGLCCAAEALQHAHPVFWADQVPGAQRSVP